MSLTEHLLDTDAVGKAKLMSTLSGNPANVCDDVFVWNGHIMDRATAVVAMLKTYNQLPVTTQAKQKLYVNCKKKFGTVTDDVTEEEIGANIWFHSKCLAIKESRATRTNEDIKQLLIYLHS